MTDRDSESIRAAVRERYARAARDAQGDASSCCDTASGDGFGAALYDPSHVDELPTTAIAASLGCGNPTALATLEPGQVVLDLGSVDVVISNCVINLAADKDLVLREAHRVLRPRGLFAVFDGGRQIERR